MMDFLRRIFGGACGESNSVNAHYGVSDKQYDALMRCFICDLITMPKVSDVIDKHFKDLDSVGRAKVHAFALAWSKAEKLRL